MSETESRSESLMPVSLLLLHVDHSQLSAHDVERLDTESEKEWSWSFWPSAMAIFFMMYASAESCSDIATPIAIAVATPLAATPLPEPASSWCLRFNSCRFRDRFFLASFSFALPDSRALSLVRLIYRPYATDAARNAMRMMRKIPVKAKEAVEAVLVWVGWIPLICDASHLVAEVGMIEISLSEDLKVTSTDTASINSEVDDEASLMDCTQAVVFIAALRIFSSKYRSASGTVQNLSVVSSDFT